MSKRAVTATDRWRVGARGTQSTTGILTLHRLLHSTRRQRCDRQVATDDADIQLVSVVSTARTSWPCLRTTDSNLSAIPLDRLLPDSHFRTVDSLVLRYRTKTGWLTWALSRIFLISQGLAHRWQQHQLRSRLGGGRPRQCRPPHGAWIRGSIANAILAINSGGAYAHYSGLAKYALTPTRKTPHAHSSPLRHPRQPPRAIGRGGRFPPTWRGPSGEPGR